MSTSTIAIDPLPRLLSRDRLSTYLAQCDGHLAPALDLYRWNAAISAALWLPLGHLEVALRNAMSESLATRHCRLGRPGCWLDDPNRELDARVRSHIASARRRVRQKGKRASDSQTISELGFGFWRYLVTRRHTGIWPDLASAFPDAPDRRRETVEDPIARLHDLRNRIAHHQRIWNRELAARYADLLLVAGCLDRDLPAWIGSASSVCALLASRPPLNAGGGDRCGGGGRCRR